MSALREASGLHVEIRSADDLAAIEAPWRDLTQRSNEPNVFVEPSFLLPALKHLAPHGLEALLAWSGPSRSRLDGLVVMRMPRAAPGVAEAWMCEQAVRPALALDSQRAAAALGAMTAFIAGHRRLALALGLPSLDRRGSAAEASRAVARARGVRPYVAAERPRALLRCGLDADFEALLDPKRRKEWRRQRRRLEERGALTFAWSPEAAAFDAFLALERTGWKGERGTALAGAPSRMAFARAMFRSFAARGEARVASLAQGGRTIASGVALRSGDRAFYWKTAFDETLADVSPGLQLTLDMSRDFERDASLALVDSCAAPDHPMIDRLWPDRFDLGDFVIPIRQGPALASAMAWRGARAMLKGEAKRIVAGLRKRG